MITIRFFAPGTPETAGSKRAFVIPIAGRAGTSAKDYRAVITDDNPKGEKWKKIVAAAAKAVHPGPPLTGPLQIDVTFHLTRPQGHFGTGRNAGILKASAPEHHITRPDATKLLRCLEDALTGVAYQDDGQIIKQIVGKIYDTREGATVEIGPVSEELF
jgi:Holliday junction resolvase RusA-like endonuclease